MGPESVSGAMRRPNTQPDKLRPFIALGFVQNGVSGNEAYGDCIYCGKSNKLYINTLTGQWSCKSGHCSKEGNLYTFLEEWWKLWYEDTDSRELAIKWQELSEDRGIPVAALKASGIVWDGNRWAIPIRNHNNTLVNLKFYTTGQKLRGLPSLDAGMWGLDSLSHEDTATCVYICEGEWDAIATVDLLRREDVSGVVVGVPGCAVFKDSWVDYFRGRDVVVCYDNDIDGNMGVARVHSKLKSVSRTVSWIDWPSEVPNKFDMRDFYRYNGTYESLREMVALYEPATTEETTATETRPPLQNPNRPSFETVLMKYRKWMHMTPELEDALRIIYAVVLSNQVEGDPLWIHIAGPPGCGKTELLTSTNRLSNDVYIASSLTPHSLVSGFQLQGNQDPSLIPQLNGKTLVLKDFTEVLNMPRIQKDEIYAILRGAFDGEVVKPFGNGIIRRYQSRFSMVTGVTHSVFAEQGASLGERFLIYHMFKGVGYDADEIIRAAITNVGRENGMKEELSEIAEQFLNVHVTLTDIPEMTPEWQSRLIAISQFVAMMRGSVEKDWGRDVQLFRGQHEIGTRLSKQLKKLMIGLSLLHEVPVFDESVWSVVKRVALDTCNGFNRDIVTYLLSHGKRTASELSEALKIPMSTLRDRFDTMEQLGVCDRETEPNPTGRGAPIIRYYPTERIQKLWEGAGLSGNNIQAANTQPRPRVRIKRRRV